MVAPDSNKPFKNFYERPHQKYRCGKERMWNTPCYNGPQPDGSCGGVYECNPVCNEKGRYECRRPSAAGGPCSEGPRPDGKCSQRHPPCIPLLSLRHQRQRLVLFSGLLVLSTLAGLLIFIRSGKNPFSPVNPGPLSAPHASFSGPDGCGVCHSAHGRGPQNWLMHLFVKEDFDSKCLTCHRFEGPAEKAHNTLFEARPGLEETRCLMCHTEHRGYGFDLQQMGDRQCQSCHSVKFKSFSDGHPQFPKNYPYEDRPSVQFDHGTHWSRHFKNPSVSAKAPANCLGCHEVTSTNQRHVVTKSYETACAQCHQTDIVSARLSLFRSPELVSNSVTKKQAYEACGPIMWKSQKDLKTDASGNVAASDSAAGAESFESVSLEEPSKISAALLDVDAMDPETYGGPMQQLMLEMAGQGSAAFSSRLAQAGPADDSKVLLAGLDPELIQSAACAWLSNQEYAVPPALHDGGWHADSLELFYQPMGHADPVLKSWIEYALKSKTSLQQHLLSKNEGPGKCIKCHALTVTQEEGRTEAGIRVDWHFQPAREEPYTNFSHGAHLHRLGMEGESCKLCHRMNPERTLEKAFPHIKDLAGTGKVTPFAGNFMPIRKETCTHCHGAENQTPTAAPARQDCTVCHAYHHGVYFKFKDGSGG